MTTDVFVIAEAGVNHNGSVDVAHQLIDIAAGVRADAVKFQTFDANSVVAAGTATVEYQARTTGATDQHEMLRKLELGSSAWKELASHCAEVGLEFMSTAFDLSSLELLLDVGVSRLKVPSGELTNLPFVRTIAGAGLPVIISTGMGTMAETVAAVEAASAAPERSVLHCVSAYPAPLDEANLAVIPTIRQQPTAPSAGLITARARLRSRWRLHSAPRWSNGISHSTMLWTAPTTLPLTTPMISPHMSTSFVTPRALWGTASRNRHRRSSKPVDWHDGVGTQPGCCRAARRFVRRISSRSGRQLAFHPASISWVPR